MKPVIRILPAYLSVLVGVISVIVTIYQVNKKLEIQFKESLRAETKQAISQITDGLSKQTERATSEIKGSLSEETAQAISQIKESLNKQTEQINAHTEKILAGFGWVVTLKEHQVYVFKYDRSSSFTFVAIDPEEKGVTVQSNIDGELRNVSLPIGRTWTVPIPGGHTYTVILTSIDTTNRTAEFVIAEKGVKQ